MRGKRESISSRTREGKRASISPFFFSRKDPHSAGRRLIEMRRRRWSCLGVKMAVELIVPIACEQGMRFAIRECGKTVGAGVIQSIIE